MPASKKKETAAAEAELSPSLVAELERRVNQVQQHNVIACINAFFNLSCFFCIHPHSRLCFMLYVLSSRDAAFTMTTFQFRSAVQKSLVDDGLGENVLGEMSDSGSEIDWEAEERRADLEEAGSREAIKISLSKHLQKSTFPRY